MNRPGPVDFTIISKPNEISFECPHCEAEDVTILFRDVNAPDSWADEWPVVECPMCGEMVQLGEWTYD